MTLLIDLKNTRGRLQFTSIFNCKESRNIFIKAAQLLCFYLIFSPVVIVCEIFARMRSRFSGFFFGNRQEKARNKQWTQKIFVYYANQTNTWDRRAKICHRRTNNFTSLTIVTLSISCDTMMFELMKKAKQGSTA